MTSPEGRPGVVTRILNNLRAIPRAIRRQFRETPMELEPPSYVDPTPPLPATRRTFHLD